MDKYVLYSYFYAINMDDVDVVLGYPWMESIGTFNNNVQSKFLEVWYKKNKITLWDIYLILTRKGPRRNMKKYVQGNKL